MSRSMKPAFNLGGAIAPMLGPDPAPIAATAPEYHCPKCGRKCRCGLCMTCNREVNLAVFGTRTIPEGRRAEQVRNIKNAIATRDWTAFFQVA